MKKSDRVILAMDFISFEEFERMLNKTKSLFSWYKVHSIFLREHRRVCDTLREEGKRVFLDLKFFDIPATVEKHIRVISSFADMFTIHLLSGRESLKVAVEVSREERITPVGVGVLTSFSDEDLLKVGIGLNVREETLRLIEVGVESGISHFVCSPLETKIIKDKFPFAKVITPGVRITPKKDDQKRVTTPREAFSDGADFIVIGRDIMRLAKPEDILKYL